MTIEDKDGDRAKRIRGVQEEIARDGNREMPGSRAPLPPGTFRDAPAGPQSDENRDQPLDDKGKPRAPDPPPR